MTETSANTATDARVEFDAIVIGGSVAGLSAALMLGRARRRVAVIDAGLPRNRFAAHMHGVLGHEGVPPATLVRRGRDEVAGYGVELREGTVERVVEAPGGLEVHTADGAAMRTRTLVVATGITDELPPIPGLAEQWGIGVLHCPYCHGWEVRDRRFGVLATSPLALHQARMVRQWSPHVTLLSAGMGAPVAADDAARLRSRGITVVDSPVAEVLAEGGTLRGVRTADGTSIALDAIFTAGAPRPHDAFLHGLDLTRQEMPMLEGDFIAVDMAGKTSHERIWAAGNVVSPMASVPIAAGAGTMAGAAANGWLVEDDFDHAQNGDAR